MIDLLSRAKREAKELLLNLPLGTKREAKVAFLNLALGEATTSGEILSEST